MTLGRRLAAAIARRFRDTEALPVSVSVSPEVVRAHMSPRYDFSAPMPPKAVFEDVDRMLQQWTEHGANPKHYGLFRPTPTRTLR